MKLILLMLEVGVSCSDKVIILSKNIPIVSSIVSAELARVTVKTEVDLEIKNIELSKLRFRQGSETKIDKFQNLLKIFFLFTEKMLNGARPFDLFWNIADIVAFSRFAKAFWF